MTLPNRNEERARVDLPTYTEEEREFLIRIRKEIMRARDQREMPHDEYDGRTYTQQWLDDTRGANSYIRPRKNADETTFTSGTVRQKLFALLASIANLNLTPEVAAFDANDFPIQALGRAMEDISAKIDEHLHDDEQKILRQFELFTHGHVFVEERWEETEIIEKVLERPFNGKLDSAKWTERTVRSSGPTRVLLDGRNVYLGDISQVDLAQQPYLVTAEYLPWAIAERSFGSWERWGNVGTGVTDVGEKRVRTDYDASWRMVDAGADQVEVLRYQSHPANEFAILVNGVLMTPPGLPLPWGHRGYSVVQQNFQPMGKFAYGKSFVSLAKPIVDLMDEFLRYGLLKTMKSFFPPYLNLSGRVVSRRAFMPGKITAGIPARTLVPIHEKEVEGVSSSELAVIRELNTFIDRASVSPVFAGQFAGGEKTATEVLETQKQAQQALGHAVLAASFLEEKLGWLRLQNLLANYFDPVDTAFDDARGAIRNRYRTSSVERLIGGEGNGRRIVEVTEDRIPEAVLIREEEMLSETAGVPVRKILVNPNILKQAKLIWENRVVPKERKSSELAKLLFEREAGLLIQLFPDVNREYLKEKFSAVWNEDMSKLFAAPVPQPAMPSEAGAGLPQREGGLQPPQPPRFTLPLAGGERGGVTI